MSKLREKKEMLVKTWEKLFDKKVEDSLTEKGLKKLWDENTDVGEASDMLTSAAINDLVSSVLGDIVDKVPKNTSGIIIVGLGDDDDDNEDVEEENTECGQGPEVKKEGMFKVVNLTTKRIYDDGFCSEEEAQDFIKETCMNTHYSVSEFGIVQEMV
jgi:hypothetical protein